MEITKGVNPESEMDSRNPKDIFIESSPYQKAEAKPVNGRHAEDEKEEDLILGDEDDLEGDEDEYDIVLEDESEDEDLDEDDLILDSDDDIDEETDEDL
jgi:hypothetical protein